MKWLLHGGDALQHFKTKRILMEGLNSFCTSVNTVVREKGFWDGMHKTCEFLKDMGTPDMAKAAEDAFIAQKIMLISSELGEAIEAMRHQNYGLEIKDTFEDEIADVFIRLSDLCGELGIDIEKQIAWKMSFNKSREQKHGKEF
ncbi:MAG: hypothetical protein PHE67_12095 [Campylobacterales bacterium]|nr:hypothetical protein [Campylobacterales bacterium]